MTNAILSNINANLTKIAATDSLKGFLPVIDGALSALASNQAGLAGDAGIVNAVGPELAAAAPQVGAQVVKDEAGSLKTTVDAAAAKAEAGTSTAG